MKLLSLFSGIGAFEKALDYLNIDYELVNYCEIDKYASKSYSLIHNVSETKNLGDITKVDEKTLPKDIDLISYGFPCQDISLAGKQRGLFNEDGSKTRSGLFFEALRIIEETKPKYAIAENVKNLTSKKFNAQFQVVLSSLEAAGYNNYWQVLNAKHYGIPQNRERVFIVSIRKDVDDGKFTFPKPFELKLRLKDMLEDVVDEKYYLSDKMIKNILFTESTKYISEDLPGNFDLRDTDKLIQVGQLYGTEKEPNPQDGRVYDPNGITPSMMSGGNKVPKIIVSEATKKGYAEAEEGDSVNLEQPNSQTRRGRVGKQVAQTLTCSCNQGVVVKDNFVVKKYKEFIDKNGFLPNMFNPYNCQEIKDIAPTQTAQCGSTGSSATILIVEDEEKVVAAEIPLKRGYSVQVKEESPDTTEIDVIGNYSKSDYKATQIVGKNGIAPTVRENHGQVTGVVVKDKVYSEDSLKRIKKNIVKDGIANTILTNSNATGNGVNLVVVKDKIGNKIPLYTKYKKLIKTIEKNEMPIGEVKHMDLYNENLTENCGTLKNPCHNDSRLWDGLRIRKLTPKECMRLMSFDDESTDKLIANGISNTQLYKQAGNSIVVDVLKYIFIELFRTDKKEINTHKQQTLFDFIES